MTPIFFAFLAQVTHYLTAVKIFKKSIEWKIFSRTSLKAKLGNIGAETLLRRQMFSSLAARETYVAETNFAAPKQKMFLPEVKNILVSRTQMLRPQHMFLSLAMIETMLIRFKCHLLIKSVSQQRRAY